MVAPPAVVVTTPTRLRPAAGRNRHPRQQRQAFDQGVERVDPRDAASLEESIGDVVLARKRAGMGDRELARRGRAAELVGDDRFAALRRRQRKPAQRLRMPHGFEKQHVAVDAGIIERGCADFAEREVDLVADRNQPGETDAAGLAAREQRTDEAAAVGGGEDAPGRQVRLVEGGVRRQHGLAAQVDHAEARRADEADAGARAGLAQSAFARQSLGAGFREAVGEHGRHLDPEAAAFLDRLDRGLGRRHDIGVVGDLRQRRERGPCALAQHLLAPGIDGIDAARIAHLAQEFQRPAGGLAGVVGLPDDGDAVGREQRLAQIGMCRCARRRGPLRTRIARQIVRGHITLRIDGSQRPGMQDSASNITHIVSGRRAGRTKKMRCPKRKSAL